MSVMHKYPLEADPAKVVLPRGALIRHIGAQQGEIFVWALVDPDEPVSVEHEYRVFSTGQPIPDDEDLEHRATVVMGSGLVWHVFEEVPF